eukprot:CAMPEP_0201680854 /NCGR_PEP_ID=MMETSP0494-20130426/50810_1 /ASSEMBLY_ACC=CAM_ASM_000839 /TAXON_ID=420259 /ORGANISM="Thalassiosira gravida, Strain GMp14c1" /LENGTH=632 /DNA_ID=CAMNT_0048164581 /DNA_START=58 /DNA_END=1957 /DNA_ORIENTATION=-
MTPIPTLHPHLLLSLLAVVATVVAAADLRLDGGTQYGWDTSAWRSQVDGVMGGKSSGSLSFERNDSVLSFTGDVVLDGGGFSSVRKAGFDESLDLTSFAGIVVTLETTFGYNDDDDGGSGAIRPPLGLHLQFHDTTSRYSVGYASAFAVPLSAAAGETTDVYLPLSSFDRGSRMGFVCEECTIDWSSVDEMDIYVLFQEGSFDVKVKEIVAVESSRVFDMPVIDDVGGKEEVRELIQSTIRSGGGLYDYGYMELCIAIYRSTLNTLLGSSANSNDGVDGVDGVDEDDVVSTTIKNMICQGLQRAETMQNNNSKANTAWALRNTMDGILEELGFSDPDQGNGWRPTTTIMEEDGETGETTSTTLVCSAVTSGAYIRIVTSDPTRGPSTERPTTLLPTTSMPVVPTTKPTTEPTTNKPTTNKPTTNDDPTRGPSTERPTTLLPTTSMPVVPTTKPTTEPTTNKPTLPPTSAPTGTVIKPTNLPSTTSTTMPIQTTTPSTKPTMSPIATSIATSTTTVGPTTLKPSPTPSAMPTETVQSTINPTVPLAASASITTALEPTSIETTTIITMIPTGSSPSPMLTNDNGEPTTPSLTRSEALPAKMLDDGSISSSALLSVTRVVAFLTATSVLLHVGF